MLTSSFDIFPSRITLAYSKPVSTHLLAATQDEPNHQKEQRRTIMPIKTPRELFVQMLSNVRQGTERTTKLVQEFTQNVQDPDVKEALEARVFVSQKILD